MCNCCVFCEELKFGLGFLICMCLGVFLVSFLFENNGTSS